METARHATAILVKLLFSHRGGRYERSISPRSLTHASRTSTAGTPEDGELFSYGYFGA